jgi:hypothetical protein
MKVCFFYKSEVTRIRQGALNTTSYIKFLYQYAFQASGTDPWWNPQWNRVYRHVMSFTRARANIPPVIVIIQSELILQAYFGKKSVKV